MSDFGKHGLASRAVDGWRPLGHLLVLLGLSLATYGLYMASSSSFSGWRSGATLGSTENFQEQCLKFMPQVSGAKLELIDHITTNDQADLKHRDASCGGPGKSKAVSDAVCRVALYVPTSARSGIHLEAWLPESWNFRFIGTGNGGLNGCLDYASLVYTTAHGFAAVASNNGHNGTSGNIFYQNPDVVHDFADRAMHTSVSVGKDIVKQFYGKEQKKSYFLGCSQGGRQGIANAIKFPSDFDGIVAGAPALDFNSLASWRASFYPLTGPPSSADFIKPEMWSDLIHDEVLRQCDHLDGVTDGIIEYPDQCNFQPEVLLCRPDGIAGASCLNDKQVDQIRRIFKPFTDPDGSIIYPGMQVGSEQRAIDRLYAGKPFTDSRDWFRYVVHSDPTWDPATFTTEDARKAQELNPFDIRTFPTPGDLQQFGGKGGKILTYHGMQDQQITGHNTGRWMEYLRAYSSDKEIEEWIRYFRISGMLHCSGGPGAWMIGQTGGSVAFEAHKNVLAAIVEWVENGVAPEVLEGTKLVDGSNAGPIADMADMAVQFTRKHCRYPRLNRYIGSQPLFGRRGGTDGVLPSSSTADEWICE